MAKAGFYGLDLYSLYRWNLRDRHMADTLDALASHLGRQRGTAREDRGVGAQLATSVTPGLRRPPRWASSTSASSSRERHADDCRLVGFTTYTGTVTAASDWEGPAQRKWVRPALADSVEELLHEVGEKEFLLRFDAAPRSAHALRSGRLQRAIGVI